VVVQDVRSSDDVVSAIKDMAVRGAPLIAATAAYGVWFACMEAEKQAWAGGAYLYDAFGRLRASRPTAVNLFWAELMGQGIVESPFDFDLARQDPKNPPPAPWTVQPSHPELLEELAADFRAHNFDFRRLLKQIVSSRAYQLSAQAPSGWKSTYDSSFARRLTRRMSAEQTWDAVAQVGGLTQSYKVTYSDKKAASVMQARSPQDIEKTDKATFTALQAFGQCDRYAIQASLKPTMTQSAILMNDRVIRDRVKVAKGSRLETLLRTEPGRPNGEVVDELYLAALSRFPTAKEREMGVEVLREYREQGAEDLIWVLLNRLDFLFY
jgi:sulfur relay (sulfurtransferase) DsrF/TusC family protein